MHKVACTIDDTYISVYKDGENVAHCSCNPQLAIENRNRNNFLDKNNWNVDDICYRR